MSTVTQATTFKMLVNGSLVEAQESFAVVNPSTGQSFAQCPHASAEQAEAAISSANEAFKSWSILSLEQRKEHVAKAKAVIEAAKPELAEVSISLTAFQIQALAAHTIRCVYS